MTRTDAPPPATAEPRDVLSEIGARALLAPYGIPLVESVLTTTDDEVRQAVDRLGPKVVIKAAGREVLHKSDRGLVQVGISGAAAAVTAARQVRERSDRGLDGVLVQRQASGVEIIVGVQRDALLGPFVLVGMGGILAELLRDVVLHPAVGLSHEVARSLIGSLRAGPALHGYRGRPPADVGALADLVVDVAHLATERPDVAELDLNPVMVGEPGAGVVAVDARAVLVPASTPPPSRPARDLRPLLAPRSIAVVGASADRKKIGSRLLRYLVNHGYDGKLFPVHGTADVLLDHPVYHSVAEIPMRVDLVAVVVAADRAVAAVEDAISAAARSIIVYSAGFAEAGDDGRRAQEHLAELCRSAGILLCGPNSMGIMSPGDRVFAAFAGTLERESVPAGSIGFVSQSGAIASSLMSRSLDAGVGYSRWITVGNEADLDVADYLDFLADDPATRVITLYLEAVRRPAAFRAAVARARANGKPVIAFLSGRSRVAQMTIASHTGALAGESSRYDSWLRTIGVVRVNALETLLEAGQAIAAVGAVHGPRVGILTMSGGTAAILADACADLGLEVPALSEATHDRLAATLPPSAATRNPVDVTAMAMTEPDLLLTALAILLGCGELDVVILQLTTNADPVAATIASGVVEAQACSSVPLLVSRLGAESLAPRAHAIYAQAAIPVFTWPENAARVAHALVAAGQARRHAAGGERPA